MLMRRIRLEGTSLLALRYSLATTTGLEPGPGRHAAVGQHRRHLLHPLLVQAVIDPAPLPPILDDAGVLESLEVKGEPGLPGGHRLGQLARSEERRVGKECRSRWSPYQ